MSMISSKIKIVIKLKFLTLNVNRVIFLQHTLNWRTFVAQKTVEKIQQSVARLKDLGSGISKWLPIVLAAIAGFIALIYKRKAEQAETDALIAQTQAKDAPLVAKQRENEKKIEDVKNQDDSKLTPEERADRWNK